MVYLHKSILGCGLSPELRAPMMVHSRSGFRRIDKIRLGDNVNRVLNLFALERTLSGEPTDFGYRADLASSNPGRFFHNQILSRAIFLKHNLRPEEKRLFAAHRPVETKILVPIDGNRLECGAQSFFIGEYSYARVVREVLKMNPDKRDQTTGRDLKLLDILRDIPSFDPFILSEALRLAGISVDQRYFDASYNQMKIASEAVYSDFRPLIEAAIGTTATKEQLGRFVDQVWNVTEATSTNLFFETLRIPKSEWHDIVFAWKALLFYRLEMKKVDGKLPYLISAMQNVKLNNNVTGCDRKELRRIERHLVQCLVALKNRSSTSSERAIQSLVKAVSVQFDAVTFRESLRQLSPTIVNLGTDVTVFDQAVSYYNFLVGQKGAYIDGLEYESMLRSLDELISLRFAA
jgi:hypothetical protein